MSCKSISLALCLGACLASGAASAANNVVFLNNPSLQDVKDVGNFTVHGTGKPFFNELVLFAANINGASADKPVLYYNTEMSNILSKNIDTVKALQKKGIKVQIAYLGNHQNAGWSCNMSKTVATGLADLMVADVVKYGLDGIDVDDEYSSCSGNTTAFYNVLSAIKSNPDFDGKILSKALWSDSAYFKSTTNVAKLLTEGYEMTYNENVTNLAFYNTAGMGKNQLLLGIDPGNTPSSRVYDVAKSVASGGYAGVMIWAPNGRLSTSSAATYYTNILKAQTGSADSAVDYVSSP
ncbi:hypothetical protein KR767_16290 [Luteibacter anthropi]|uniref:glycosyl hydrolase family 18 protein n=1 Tax=Luteibacter anthropi TaxID=564369 RepID=UPI002032412F|nr:glycosyl hydrolase family 18 protein [Luteibacter anthropi]URX61608.1 hypothetical protein KR767_16290 [Luteibacter anthropi]